MVLRNFTRALLLSLLCSPCLFTSAQAGLLSNGNFELYTSSFTAGAPSQLADTATGGYTTLNDWLVGLGSSGTFGFLTNPSGDSSGSCSPRFTTNYTFWGPAQGAFNGFTGSSTNDNFVALATEFSLAGDGMTQYLSGLSVGTQYQVSFEWAAGQSTNHTGNTTLQLEVLFGSDQRLTPLINLPSQGFASCRTRHLSLLPAVQHRGLISMGTALLESVVLPSSTTSIWSPLAPALPLYRNLPQLDCSQSVSSVPSLLGSAVAALQRPATDLLKTEIPGR
jgi:hypothetical protein